MSTFTLTELSNKSGEILEAAYRGPVALTRHGKRKYVLLTAEQFDRLSKLDDPRRVYGPGETPPELADMILTELDRQSAEYRAGKDD